MTFKEYLKEKVFAIMNKDGKFYMKDGSWSKEKTKFRY